MLGSSLATRTAGTWHHVADRLKRWSAESQQQARRNAMVAATACAQRRAERDDAAAFVAQSVAARATAPAPATPDTHRAHG